MIISGLSFASSDGQSDILSLREIDGRFAFGKTDKDGAFTPWFFLSPSQSGASLGDGSQTWLAPNPTLQGRLTLTTTNAPSVRFRSTIAANPVDIWQDETGDFNIDTRKKELNIYANTLTANDSVFTLNNHNTANTIMLWQNNDGNGIISANGANNILTLYASRLSFQAVPQYWGTTTDISKCGSLPGSTGCRPIMDSNGTTHYAPYW